MATAQAEAKAQNTNQTIDQLDSQVSYTPTKISSFLEEGQGKHISRRHSTLNTANNQARNFPMSDNFVTSYDNMQNLDRFSNSKQSSQKVHVTETDNPNYQKSPDISKRDLSRSRKKIDK